MPGTPLWRTALLIGVCLFSACAPQRSYDIRGRIVGFGSDGRTLIVDHEEVAGYMPAMTMPFTASSAEAIAGLETGHAVAFRLVVTRDSVWITDVEHLPDDAVAWSPSGDNARTAIPSGDAPILQPGDSLPAFSLVDQDGRTLQRSDFEGQALLITFVYTRCPLPTYCPLLSQKFAQLQRQLQPAHGNAVRLLTVSFDTAHDTPEVLRDYAARYDADLATWTFATGTPEQVGFVTHLFGLYARDAADGTFDHSLTTALVGPDGTVRRIWRGNDWQPDEVAEAVRQALRTGTT